MSALTIEQTENVICARNVSRAVVGSGWGPAADGSGEWFVRRAHEGAAERVAGKEAAVKWLELRGGERDAGQAE